MSNLWGRRNANPPSARVWTYMGRNTPPTLSHGFANVVEVPSEGFLWFYYLCLMINVEKKVHRFLAILQLRMTCSIQVHH